MFLLHQHLSFVVGEESLLQSFENNRYQWKDWYSSIEFNYKEFKEIWDAFEIFFRISSQHFPELNALNFLFFCTVKDMGHLDLQREINLVIFHLNYILIHVNILPYSVLNWEYLKMSALGTTLMTVSIY